MEFRLFVIDSSPAIHRLAEEAASTEGFEVTAFSDGPSCLDEASRSLPQIIIADFHLEGLTFTTFCDRLRDLNLTPSPMLVVLVNASDRHDENGLRQRGVSAFIHKPVQVEQLRQTIKELNESQLTVKQDKPARPRRSWPPESVTMGDDSPSVVEDTPTQEPAAKQQNPIEIREPVRRIAPLESPSQDDARPAAAAAAVAARNNRMKAGESAAPGPPAEPRTALKKDPSFSSPPAAAPASIGSEPAAAKREPAEEQAPAVGVTKPAAPPPAARPQAETRHPSKDHAAPPAAAKTSPPPAPPSQPPTRTPPGETRAPSKDYAATIAAIQAAATPPEDLTSPGTPAAPERQPEASPSTTPPPRPEPAGPSAKGNGGNGDQGLPSPLEESMRGFLANLLDSLSQGSQEQIAKLVSRLVAEHVNAELSRKIQSEVAAQVAAALPREEIARITRQAAEEKLPGLVAQHLDAMERSVKQQLTEQTGDMVRDLTKKLLPEMTEPVLQKHLPDLVQQHMGLVDGLVKEAAQQAATAYTAEMAERIIRQVASDQVGQLVTNAVADIAEAQVKQELARLTAPE